MQQFFTNANKSSHITFQSRQRFSFDFGFSGVGLITLDSFFLVTVLMTKVSWILQTLLLLQCPVKLTGVQYTAATSKHLKNSLEFLIVHGILFKAQFKAAHFATAISTSKRVSQAVER